MRVISGGRDGTVRIWDPATGARVGEALRSHEGWVNSVALGEIDGAVRLVSGGSDATVRIWDPATAVGFPPVSTLASVGAVAVGADGDIYFAAGVGLCRITLRTDWAGPSSPARA